jgi:hypothetical protein
MFDLLIEVFYTPVTTILSCRGDHVYMFSCKGSQNGIVFENFTASIGDLMVANRIFWQRDSGACKRIFATRNMKQLR